jgi:GcrA cell cycle regulator
MAQSAGWNDERIEHLKKEWAAGRSANQIAADLKLTRNAVIGKVHRLGLNRRSGSPEPRRMHMAAPRPKVAKAPQPRPQLMIASNGCVVEKAEPRPPRVQIPARVEGPGSATLLTVGAHMCKWPIGDPMDKEFTLCGRGRERGSYCASHAALAYAPASSTPKELMRGLRRYV